jgi:hypothetical protein
MKTWLRPLSITWTTGWGFIAVLSLGLWTRSYMACEEVRGRFVSTWTYAISSDDGNLWVDWSAVAATSNDWAYEVRIPSHYFRRMQQSPPIRATSVCIAYWFVVLTTTVLAVVPWLNRVSWKFAVRNLLIATTLLAALLGLFNYLKG